MFILTSWIRCDNWSTHEHQLVLYATTTTQASAVVGSETELPKVVFTLS